MVTPAALRKQGILHGTRSPLPCVVSTRVFADYGRTHVGIMSGPGSIQSSTPCVAPLTAHQVIHPVNMVSEKREELSEVCDVR